jgi:hypothetical protein
MSVTPLDTSHAETIRASRRGGFWHRLGQKLDTLFADSAKRAASKIALRHAAREIDPCHKSMQTKISLADERLNLTVRHSVARPARLR